MSVPFIPPVHLERIFAPIPTVKLVSVAPRPLNDRLWELARKEADGIATADEILELDCICRSIEGDTE